MGFVIIDLVEYPPDESSLSTAAADSEMIGTIASVQRLVGTHNGSGRRALPATPAAALRNIPALPAQALAGIQERLAQRVQIGDNSHPQSRNGGQPNAPALPRHVPLL